MLATFNFFTLILCAFLIVLQRYKRGKVLGDFWSSGKNYLLDNMLYFL